MPTMQTFPHLQVVCRVEKDESCNALTDTVRKVEIVRVSADTDKDITELPEQQKQRDIDCCQSFWLKSRGFIFAISSGLLLTVYSYLFKKTNNSVLMPSVLLCRGLLECLTLTAVALWKKESPMAANTSNTTTASMLMLVVAVMGGFRALFIFLGLELLDMSSVHVILNAAPVVVTFMSACCLGERLTWFSLASCLLLLSGVGCIFGPSIYANYSTTSSSSSEMLGLAFALVALFFNASVSVFGKKVNPYFTQHWITAYNGASIVVTALVAYTVDDSINNLIKDVNNNNNNNNTFIFNGTAAPADPTVWPEDTEMWLLVLGTAVAGMLQQFTFFCALHYESAARTTMVRSVQMVFSWLVEVSEGHEVRLLTILGIFILLLAIFVVTVEKERDNLSCLNSSKNNSAPVEEGEEEEEEDIPGYK